MRKLEEVYKAISCLEVKEKRSIAAIEISSFLKLNRANVSRYLNILVDEGRLSKTEGRPVLYSVKAKPKANKEEMTIENNLDKLAEVQKSLTIPIQQAKAAILYPPRGLHTLILGETGVGKSMFAELMHRFAKEANIISREAPLISFNCADYAENPQLVLAQIFGVKKGAYTGADKDKIGLLKRADGGILFLDEVHRLSPQGQEMLFTFIDTGHFRPLGETDKLIKADVQLIAATTENPKSFLLNTFARRIPMIITLPPLREKTLGERYHLIEYFIKRESERIGKSIYVNKSSLISLLLYECANNIGQLGSDIQLACAKAFLNYKSKKGEYLLITQQDMPQHVIKGLMLINESRDELDKLLKTKSDILRFSSREDRLPNISQDLNGEEDFYGAIEKKLNALKSSGMLEEEINQIINIDIESHFQKYLGNLQDNVKKQELLNIIDEESLAAAEELLKLAEDRLKRKYDSKIMVALALHLQGFIERVKRGVKIYHPKLNIIRAEFSSEFMVAMEAVRSLDNRFQIQTPLDEIGYLTMFLAARPMNFEVEEMGKVGILVIMHGASTASSMVEVANALVGVEHAVAIDMPLNRKPQEIYELAKQQVINLSKGKGVILMVDMGSLNGFGDMIYEDTGIIVKTIEMVSTPIVLDACRKAVLGRDINEIMQGFKELRPLSRGNDAGGNQNINKSIIITACFTGEGAAERLKGIIEESLANHSIVEVIPLNLLDRRRFLTSINKYKENHRILALIGTIDVHVDNIPFITAEELIAGDGLIRLNEILEEEETFIKIGQSLKSHLTVINGEEAVQHIRGFILKAQEALQITLKREVCIGILLHICFMLERLKNGEESTPFEGLSPFKDQNHREMIIVGDCLETLAVSYDVALGDNEAAYLCKMFFMNCNEYSCISV